MLWFKHTSIIATLVLTTSAAMAATPSNVSRSRVKTIAATNTSAASSRTSTTQTKMSAASSSSSGSSTNTSTMTAAKPKAETPPIFSGFLLTSRSTSLYDFQDGSKSDGMDYTFRLAARLGATSKYGVKLTAIYSDDLNNPESNDNLKDTNISLGRAPGPVGGYLLMSPSIGVGLPTSKDSRDRQQLNAAGKLGLTTIVNPEKLITGLNIMVNLIGTKNFHAYDTATDGKVNTAYGLIQNANFVYTYKAVSLTLDFVHMNTWSYQDVMRDVFEMTQELGVSINDNVGIAIGHTNGGSTLKADGVNSNVQVMNENTSMVYASLLLAF